jgi:hypothetical protein
MSYLPLATDKVKKYFSKFIEATDNSPTVWFDYKGTIVPTLQKVCFGVEFLGIS